VIWVGGDRRSAAILGHRSATTYADALEIASNTVGRAPSITVLRGPGLALGDVRGAACSRQGRRAGADASGPS
ncbi:MAG TPA: hypothetical protein VLQ67_07110, partial [Arachnia sp.]|nr:hypothetical protein [Arachnia sp.]